MVNQVEQFMSGQDPGNVAVSLKIGTSLTYEMLATLDNNKEVEGAVIIKFHYSY